MILHIVGGFLGSGKTTAIAAASKQLLVEGRRVAVVTNDQGQYLVDEAFLDLAEAPAVSVSGGCFCCHYDDLAARLADLQAEARPDVVFAESVGSCADLVATVIRPLLTLPEAVAEPASFSVFADARLLQRRLNGQEMPYSDNIVYIFDRQIEEAGLLVINKKDLLSPAAQAELLAQARNRFPDKVCRLQSGFDAGSVAGWLAALPENAAATAALPSLSIDYERYGAGEADLAWVDQVLLLQPPIGEGHMTVNALLQGINEALVAHKLPLGHVKFLIDDGRRRLKVSLPNPPQTGWNPALGALEDGDVQVIVNARVAGEAATVARLLDEAATAVLSTHGAPFSTIAAEAFHPGFPTPTHRL